MNIKTALTATWAAFHTFQYGFAISAMNGIQAVVMCPSAGVPTPTRGLAPCVPMTASQFGLVVSVFTIGGLVGSLASRSVVAGRGQRGTLRASALAILLGSSALALANNILLMVLARIVVGLGCGLATTTVPLVLADVAPPGSKKALGIANQLFIVLGILAAQTLSFPFGKMVVWRFVPATAAAVALAQLLGSLLVRLPGDYPASNRMGEAEPLICEDPPLLGRETPLTISELLSSYDPEVTRGCSAKAIALAIVILKVPITISPAFLIERVGTRPLLLLPTSIMVGAMFALASGLNSGGGTLSVAGMVAFVAAFSVGLGPVTWVVLGEVMPTRARPATSAVGLAVNWSTNFVVGAAFLPLQQRLGDSSHPGNIFYLFSGACVAAVVAIQWGYHVYEAR
ncbi:hypothetical protein CspeluHIS016_0309980 [Cutaneotrichosporon spelunceum]|uniref:Major facilitator superfamily (MFS) profile domain-containing protein n=1 Tax=Cutaneotrichosporon spelunceum TaxID=1672016 RepID=A0AAD3YCI2_9TREE|nr:hypothetical protein CspeluHIS016_0309980 [Cutaneotrichosporon spelunceum]